MKILFRCNKKNKTRTSKVGAISKAQKAQNILEFFFQKMSNSAETCRRGDPLGTSGFVGFPDKVKNERGTL